MAALAVFAAAALGVLSGSPSKFEADDGNMVVDTSGNNDWNSITGAAAYNHVADTPHSGSDDSFVSGQKQDTACPDIEGHQNPPKDDFTHVASYSETNNDSSSAQFRHTFLYGATIRYAANGNASENVELNQGGSGNCIANDPTSLLKRTPGDKLIAIDYSGGADVDFHVLTWIDGTDPTNDKCFVANDPFPCWGSKVDTLSDSSAEGGTSTAAITAADNKITNVDLKAGEFAEFGVDLADAGIIPAGTCKAFPQTVWESRASGSSFVSTTKDVKIEKHTISNCGTIKVIKQTNPRGIDQKFSFTSDLIANASAGGVACTTGGSAGVASGGAFCLNDSGNTNKTLGSTAAGDNSGGNTVSENNLPAGTYKITEGADPAGFAFKSVTCTPSGKASISGREATVTLGANDVVTCVYQNDQQLGAIKITKRSIKTTGNPPVGIPLSGAKFAIKGPNGQALSGSPFTTNSSGVVCKDGLALGDYKVQETDPPTGFARDDDTEHTVTVTGTNAKCSDSVFTGQTLGFTDTPLTNLSAHVESQVATASGGTASKITCTNASAANIGNSPQPGTGFGNPETVTANDLRPGTYTCTVVIDP